MCKTRNRGACACIGMYKLNPITVWVFMYCGRDTDSEYVPTPERPVALKVSRTDLPNEVAFMEVYQQEKFVESINKI